MANPISKAMRTGTIGELLVQLRLLQFGVQAAAPLKDSGNDLVALKGTRCHTIQVKTTANGNLPAWPFPDKIYSLLAVVELAGEDRDVFLDNSSVYLVPKHDLPQLERNWESLHPYSMTGDLVDRFFAAD